MSLHERIAEVLGWTVAETQSFPLQALRELVRPISPKLAYLISEEIRTGAVVRQPRGES